MNEHTKHGLIMAVSADLLAALETIIANGSMHDDGSFVVHRGERYRRSLCRNRQSERTITPWHANTPTKKLP